MYARFWNKGFLAIELSIDGEENDFQDFHTKTEIFTRMTWIGLDFFL